jgi:hypothetical protein
VVRWHKVTFKTAIGLGAILSLLVTSGAGYRWGEAFAFIDGLF